MLKQPLFNQEKRMNDAEFEETNDKEEVSWEELVKNLIQAKDKQILNKSNKVKRSTKMNRNLIAQELVKIAKDLIGFEFDKKEDLQKYLKQHPKADKSLHYVKKQEPRKEVKEKVKEKIEKRERPADLKKLDKRMHKLMERLKEELPTNVRDLFFKEKKELSEHEIVENAKKQYGQMLHPQLVKDAIGAMVKDEYMSKKGDKYRWNFEGEFTS